MRKAAERPGDKLNFNKDPQYKKYKGVYTNYCIYIDENIKNIVNTGENPIIEKNIFTYIAKTCYVLACKERYFDNFSDYEDFSYYAAAELYNVFKSKYKNQGTEKRGKVIKPIKSSLNFIRDTLYPLKVDYAKRFFADTSSANWSEKNAASKKKEIQDKKQAAIGNFIKGSVESDYSYLIENAVEDSLRQLPNYLREMISESPFKNDAVTCQRLYLSALITFAYRLNISANALEKHSSKKNTGKDNNCILLWHLKDDMKSYVDLLLIKLKERLSDEVKTDINSYSIDETTMDNILNTAYSTYDVDQVEEL